MHLRDERSWFLSSPTVAGAAVLFKHWYLDAHGSGVANTPGRVLSNLLNMADGVTFNAWSGGARVPPPAVGWGLGRFRMRRYTTGHMQSRWLRGTTAVTISDSNPFDAVWLGGGVRAWVPPSTKGLVVTLWWLEVNTGLNESKATIDAYLYRIGGVNPGLLASATSGRDDEIRLQFDCYDSFFDRPPWGDLCLFIGADRVPLELRPPGRNTRTIYTWYWEGGRDQSLVAETSTLCAATSDDHCAGARPEPQGPRLDTNIAALGANVAALGVQLQAVEGMIRARVVFPRTPGAIR